MKRILLYALVAFPVLLLSSCNKEMEENVAGLTAEQKEMAATLESLKGTDAELDALIDAVEARIVTLEGKVADLESGVGDLETSVGDLESDFGDLGGEVDGLGESVGSLQQEIATLRTSLETLQAMDSKINSTIQELQTAIQDQEGQMYQFNNRLTEIEQVKSEFEELKSQLEELGVIKADVDALKESLTELLAADVNLNSLLSALETRTEDIEAEIAALKANAGSGGSGDSSGDSSGETDAPSSGNDTSSDNSQIENIEARISELEGELEEANQAITTLEGSMTEVRHTIQNIAKTMLNYANKTELNTLQTELVEEINAVKASVTALTEDCAEKFELVEANIETIEQQLNSLEEANATLSGLISALEGRASEIKSDIETLETSVNEDIEGVNSSIAALNGELTQVNSAIQDLTTKDIQIDAAITTLNNSLNANSTAIDNIRTNLEDQLSTIRGLSERLDAHIQTANTTFATKEALSDLATEIAQLKTDYEARFDLIESEIGGIVAMIQSMTPISKWSNGDASARYYTDWANEKNNLATVEFNYIVRPSGAAARLAQAWAENKDLMQFRAHYTITRASFDFVDMDVMDVSASDDILTVTGYVDGISEEWIKDQESFSVSLLVTDGKTDYCTPFVNIRGDLQGTDLSADETANCYMVHEPGYYRFKIHRTIDSHSAEVLWESLGTAETPEVGCLVEPELEIRNNFVYFKTNDAWKDGNALIAVKNAAGEVVWSWHIWMTGDLPQERTYNNSAGTIMGVNLGGFDRTGFESGLLYQHSRKDPFLGYASTGDVQAKSTLEWPEPVASDEQTGTYAYTVQNPTVFITMNNLNSDWFYTGTSSLPIPSQVGGVWSNSAGKSQNDPCPPGWRIPKGNTLVSVNDRESVNKYNIWSVAYNSDFTATSYTLAGLFCYDKFGGSKMSNNGDYFFSGYLSEETGVIRQGGVEGYCWAATNLGDYGYNCLQINKDKTVKHLSTAISGARAVSVRCVKK